MEVGEEGWEGGGADWVLEAQEGKVEEVEKVDIGTPANTGNSRGQESSQQMAHRR